GGAVLVAQREDRSDARSLAEVPLQPGDAEPGGGNEPALLVDLVGLERQHPQVPAAGAPGEPAAAVDRNHQPAVEPASAREQRLEQRRLPRHPLWWSEVEDAGVLEEELSLLGEEQ